MTDAENTLVTKVLGGIKMADDFFGEAAIDMLQSAARIMLS